MIRSRLWAAATVAAAGLFLGTLPVAPKLWFQVLPLLQPHVTAWYLGVGAVAAAALMTWSWWTGPHRRAEALLYLALLLGAYAALLFAYYRGEAPAKKFHLLEYGLLSGLAFQAVRVDPADRRGLLLGLLFLFLVGTADEAAQGFIPMRTFRWMDLFANYIGSALGGLAWTTAAPSSPWRRG